MQWSGGDLASGGLRLRRVISAVLVVMALLLFSATFFALDQAYFRFVNARFPSVGDSWALATLWGVVSRLHVLLPTLAVATWRPRFVGLQVGSTVSRWRMLALMLVVNCGVVVLFLLATGATPFSGDQWLITETVTVPLVEELMWRGVVLSVALHLLTRVRVRGAVHVAVWSTGLAFGVLHLGNALTGAPASFAVLQAVSAAAWGVLYGYARTSTDSIYPPILLHAAMNATVVLLS